MTLLRVSALTIVPAEIGSLLDACGTSTARTEGALYSETD